MSYKNCFVPSCSNSTLTAGHKMFIHVPMNQRLRRRWCETVGVECKFRSTMYCCEDHFNIQEDLENFMEVKLMGRKKRLKRNVLPRLNLVRHDENYTAVCFVRSIAHPETDNLIVPDIGETRESLPREGNTTIEKLLEPKVSVVKKENEELTATGGGLGLKEENAQERQHHLGMEVFVKQEEEETQSNIDRSVDPQYRDNSAVEEPRLFKKEDEGKTGCKFGKLVHVTPSLRDNTLEGVDMELLIKEVKKYPEIWKIPSEEYHPRMKKRNAWISICRVLCERFDQKDDQDKNEICNTLIKKWRNIKDNYLKSIRKKTKTGEAEVSRRQYVYARQLSFLQIGAEEDLKQAEENNAIRDKRSKYDQHPRHENNSRKRRHDKVSSELDFRMTSIPPSTRDIVTEPNTDRLFFESLLPSLSSFTEDQKLEFRCEVLNTIQQMRKSQRNETTPKMYSPASPVSSFSTCTDKRTMSG